MIGYMCFNVREYVPPPMPTSARVTVESQNFVKGSKGVGSVVEIMSMINVRVMSKSVATVGEVTLQHMVEKGCGSATGESRES